MDPQLWWYLARVGGLMSWWLLSATVVWGLLLSTRVTGPRAAAARLYDLHRFLSGLALAFLTVHMLALVADSWVDIGLLELLVPFASGYRPAAVAWGVIAFELAAAIGVTSLLKTRIPHRWWRYVHTSAFPVFILTTVHALTAGTDAGTVRWTALVLVAAISFLSVYRLLAVRRTDDTVAPSAPVRPEPPDSRPVIVKRLRPVADGVVLVELAATDGGLLPAWEPGAHIDLALPSGRIRPYSLCGDPADRTTYRIGVLNAPKGLGGSAEVHALRTGRQLAVSRPLNRFPLVLAPHYLFIAGGIGITALLPMIHAAEAVGHDWRLLYGGRTRLSMAFTDELLALGTDRVHLVPQDTDGLPDLHTALSKTTAGTAVYCCGPEPLIVAVEKAVTDGFPHRHLHIERFAATAKPSAARPFQVELRRTGSLLPVPADRTLLDVIRQAVPGTPASCEAGACGTCALRVLAGTPDHRDAVLTGPDRSRRDLIYPCVSRSHSPTLVIDL
ncbi:2Fe-2S iron-sulfur cluster-binding protein [Streptomyces erythrochromogenes]|uniref:2Fe-2S iron-sulfur cluster-binding protein n=1 Tax=Streptomyces erythrochromogenes TaxID=285574 RepID=UPI00224EEB2C|nr:2Fe-2S iron-sulfur cluster-binding protein [Streptomyces erythrochromogenes]MCX5582938.1 2Fe-2S iron-sulfur cluster-binding protein [Streptomyces erythrochromogenes]